MKPRIGHKPILRRLYTRQFDRIEKYLDQMDLLIRAEQQDFNSRMAKQREGATTQELDELADWFAEDASDLFEEYPNLLFSTAFATTCGIAEHDLIELCKENRRYREAAGLPVPPINTAQPLFVRDALLHWSSHGTDIPTKFPIWAEIDAYFDVRNQIMHSGGRRVLRKRLPKKDVPKDRSDRVDAYVERREGEGRKGISFHQDTLRLTHEYCLEAVGVYRAFFRDLVESIPE